MQRPPTGRAFSFLFQDATTLAPLDRALSYSSLVIRTSLINTDNQIKVWDVWMHLSLKEPRQEKKKMNLGQNPQRDSLQICLQWCGLQSSVGSSATNPLFKSEGWSRACCQVDTYPGGTGVATPTSSPPSIFAPFIFALPPTHLPLQPQRPQIQLLPGSSGRKQLGSGKGGIPIRFHPAQVGKEKDVFCGFISNKKYE